MTIGRLLVDRIAGRFGPAFVVRWGSALAALGILIVMVAPSFLLAATGWALFGLGLSGVVPQLFTAAGNISPARQSIIMSRVVGAGYVGQLGRTGRGRRRRGVRRPEPLLHPPARLLPPRGGARRDRHARARRPSQADVRDSRAVNMLFRLLLLRLRCRLRPRLSIWDTATTPFRVVPTDLDVLRHMNNGTYLSIMDLGRMDLMIRSGMWEQFSARGWYPVVAGQSITYRRSLTLGQRFEIASRVVGFADRWIYLEQTFTLRGTIVAQAMVRARFLKRSGGSVEQHELEEVTGPLPAQLEVPAWVREWTQATRVTDRPAS